MLLAAQLAAAQKPVPWNQNQLMPPATLAQEMTRLRQQLGEIVILSVGPDAMIQGSVDMGQAHEKDNLEKLRSYLEGLDRSKEIVVYCGCCPFDKCPNIRPAFNLLTEMGFKNAKVLDLPTNIKTNWLDKGYPVTKLH